MRIGQLLLGSVLAMLASLPLAAQTATPAPVLSSIQSPYPPLQTRVAMPPGSAANPYPPGAVSYGPPGTPLVLSGKDFGAGGTVSFAIYGAGGTVAAQVTSWSPTIIFLTVPNNAGAGPVVVTTDEGKTSNALPFVVTGPPGTHYAASCPAIAPNNQLQITTSSLPNGMANQTYSATLKAIGSGNYTWSLSTALPSGLALNASTGAISGTPQSGAGPLSLNVSVLDNSSHLTASAILSLTIDSPTLTPATVYSYSANYDHVGNVTSYNDQVMGQWNFHYDNLNRLASGTPSTGAYAAQTQYLCMNYDSFGNRTQSDFQTTACAPATDPPTAKYNAANQVTFTTVNAQSNGLTYDPSGSGNVTYDGANWYAYDGEGRICAVQSEPYNGGLVAYAYIYDAEGRRVGKGTITPSPIGQQPSCNMSSNNFNLTESYVLGQSGEQLTTLTWSNGASTWQSTNVYGEGKLIATYDAAGLHFQLTDPLGTRRVQTNSAAEAELDCQSLPFGDQQSCFPDPNAPNDDADEDATGAQTPIHFTNKQHDTESGNDYFGARYLASSMGRFLSPDFNDDDDDPDPVPYADLGNPQSLNLYGYVNNNPLSRVDPDGHDDVECCDTIEDIKEMVEAGTAEGAAMIAAAGTYLLPAGTGAVAGTAGALGVFLDAQEAGNDPAERAYMNRMRTLTGAHRKDARPSTKGKHQKGQGRRKKDKGGEKGDARRQENGMYGRKPPPGHKGPWPPKDNNNNGFNFIPLVPKDDSSVTTSQHDNLPPPPPPPSQQPQQPQ